jgi:hypothetical protein
MKIPVFHLHVTLLQWTAFCSDQVVLFLTIICEWTPNK